MIELGINVAARHRAVADRINIERDRRIREGFVFGGHAFDFDEVSKARITGAATLAGFAVAGGAQTNDLRWNGAGSDFTWLDRDNVNVAMDAQACFAMGAAAAEHERAHIFAARALKDMDPVPGDFDADGWWPSPAA